MNNCFFCGAPALLLCDGRIVGTRDQTCDRPLCNACAVAGAGGVVFICARPRSQSRIVTRDYCKECASTRSRSGVPYGKETEQLNLLDHD